MYDNYNIDTIYICSNCYNLYDFVVKDEKVLTFIGNADRNGADYSEYNVDRQITCRQCRNLIDDVYGIDTADLDDYDLAHINYVQEKREEKKELTEQDKNIIKELIKKKGWVV